MILLQLLAAGANVSVALMIVGEVGPREAAVAPAGLVEHWGMRLDATLVHQPGKIFGGSIASICCQPLGPEAEPLLRPLYHVALCCDFGLAHRSGRLDIHDDGVLQIDQIVGAVGEEGQARHSLPSSATPGLPAR